MSHVVVFGATGYAGGHITRELASRGKKVTGVARSVDSVSEGVQGAAGSIFDEAFVRDVTRGADEIVVALRASAENDDAPALIDALPLLTDIARAEDARLSFVGGAGSLHVTEGGPRLVDGEEFPDAYKGEALAHADILEALRTSESDLNWFYVSPAASFGSWNPGERTGTFRIGSDILLVDENGNSDISGADLAIAYADEIERRERTGERFTVAY